MVTAGQAFSGAILAANKDSWWHAQKQGMGEEKTEEAETENEALLSFFGL